MILRTKDNELYVLGTIWSGDGLWFVSELNRLEKQYNNITIKLHTYGGSVFDGNLMCNAVEQSSANLTLEIIGIAASMGAVFALSFKNVKIVENGYVMTHAPSSGSYGEAKDHESAAELLRMIEKNFLKKLCTRLQISELEAKKYIERDTWLDAEACKEKGIASEIIPSVVETILPIDDPEQIGELDVYNSFTNILLNPVAIGLPQNTKQFYNDNMKKLLIQTFALTTVTEASSDTALVEAVQEKFNEMKTGKENAEAELKNFRETQINAMIDSANLPEEEKGTYKTIGLTSGVEALATVLKDKTKPTADKPLNINGLIQPGGGATPSSGARADWDFKKWQQEDPKGLEKMSEDDPEKFQELFNAQYKK